MPALDFPSSPTLNQIYTANGKSWIWDGNSWNPYGAGLPNKYVTYSKIQDVSEASRLLGRGSAGGSGTVEEITIGTGLSMSGTTLSSTASGGAVIAIKSAIKTDTQSLASGTWTDITNLSITYAPTSSSNKILVVASVQGGCSVVSCAAAFRLVRDSTPIGIGNAAGNRTQVSAMSYPGQDGVVVSTTMSVLDSPASTSSIVYKVQFRRFYDTGSGTVYVNRANTDTDSASYGRYASTITIYEVTP